MEKIAQHVGKEIEVQALGRTWRFSRWTRRVWQGFLEWAKTQLADPIEGLHRHIKNLTLQDAEIMRELIRKDQEEEEKAKKEGRAPVLMLPRYQQMADKLADRAIDASKKMLAINSPEIQQLLMTPPGETQLAFLLLRQHQADVTADQAADIIDDIGPQAWANVLRAVAGQHEGGQKNEQAPAA